jgi:hypothetical protein
LEITLMLGHGPIGSGPVKPTPFPKKQAELLLKLRGELDPNQLVRWGAVIDEIVRNLPGRPTEGHLALAYIDEQVASGRKLDSALKNEAARETLCSRKTVDRWLNKRTK